VTSSGDAAVDRIAAGLTGYYSIAIESQPSDSNGRAHAVKVDVARPGVTVRARQFLKAPGRDPRSDAELLGAALGSPIVRRDIPLRARRSNTGWTRVCQPRRT
jgi:hypothetical protein